MATLQELQNQLASALAQIDSLKATIPVSGTLSFKVAEKKGLSVYGLQRNPVTLYIGQWEKLWKATPDLQKFALAHNAEFVRK
jgi:hypothetical protein